jgi:predicted TIM-barrel fold metal-dependent hydrolase
MENKPLERQSPREDGKAMRIIALEEHFLTPRFLEGPGLSLKKQAQSTDIQVAARYTRLIDQLCDLDAGRIASMDAAGIDIQVLSLNSPGVEQVDAALAVDMARDVNDRLAEAVHRHPSRFIGLAALPTSAPNVAAGELKRMVEDHGFKGAVINGHTRGRYMDDKFFWPILERAEALGVPLYLHPTAPPQPVIDTYYSGNYSPEVALQLATPAWGWHIETAIHVLRFILSGVFDRYPNLQLIIGHLGEALPFMLPRLNSTLPREVTKLNRLIGDYLRENVYYTISGFNFTPTFLDLLLQVGADRIMFSADYPWGLIESGRSFLEQLPISPADKEKIAHGNAELLLRL